MWYIGDHTQRLRNLYCSCLSPTEAHHSRIRPPLILSALKPPPPLPSLLVQPLPLPSSTGIPTSAPSQALLLSLFTSGAHPAMVARLRGLLSLVALQLLLDGCQTVLSGIVQVQTHTWNSFCPALSAVPCPGSQDLTLLSIRSFGKR